MSFVWLCGLIVGSTCTAFWSKVRRATWLTRMEVALTFGQTVDWASDAVHAEEVTGMDGVPTTVLVFVWGFVVVGVLGDVVSDGCESQTFVGPEEGSRPSFQNAACPCQGASPTGSGKVGKPHG